MGVGGGGGGGGGGAIHTSPVLYHDSAYRGNSDSAEGMNRNSEGKCDVFQAFPLSASH